jgi:hypothetical protein
MLEPSRDLFWRPEYAQLISDDSSQSTVLNPLQRFGRRARFHAASST